MSSKQRAPSVPENVSEETRQFKGVRMRKWAKWVSEVRIPNSRERIWLGSYHTPEQAAHAYDCAVYFLRGPNAKLNFPNSASKIPSVASLSRAEIQALAARYAAEDFRRPRENGAAFSGSESRCCGDQQVILEEQNSTLLDPFLEDLVSGQSLDSDDFSEIDLSLDDFDLLPLK